MKEKTATKVPGTKSSMFDETHHILPQLEKIALGKWKSVLPDQEQMLDHLAKCAYCQSSVELFVAAALDSISESSPKDPVRKLLKHLKNALHKIHEQEEHIAAYAEALEMHGVEEANKRFPVLAEHLKHCEACKSEVEDMRTLLRKAEEDGLIVPLREDTKAHA